MLAVALWRWFESEKELATVGIFATVAATKDPSFVMFQAQTGPFIFKLFVVNRLPATAIAQNKVSPLKRTN